MKYVFLGLAALIAITQAADLAQAGVECMADSDCSDMECCYKKHEFLVVSKKRQNTFEGYPINHQVDYAHQKGVCQKYHDLGDPCSPYDSANGYCSCNAKQGHTCQTIVTKRAVLNPFSRSYRCTSMLVASKK